MKTADLVVLAAAAGVLWWLVKKNKHIEDMRSTAQDDAAVREASEAVKALSADTVNPGARLRQRRQARKAAGG